MDLCLGVLECWVPPPHSTEQYSKRTFVLTFILWLFFSPPWADFLKFQEGFSFGQGNRHGVNMRKSCWQLLWHKGWNTGTSRNDNSHWWLLQGHAELLHLGTRGLFKSTAAPTLQHQGCTAEEMCCVVLAEFPSKCVLPNGRLHRSPYLRTVNFSYF